MARKPGVKAAPPTSSKSERWSLHTPGRYARSYDALSNALISIFERYYLPLQVMQPNEEGRPCLNEAGLQRYQQLKDRYILYMRDDEGAAQLQIEIHPSPLYRGVLNTGICDEYMNGPEEIKAAIIQFFDDLEGIAAPLKNVRVDFQQQRITVAGPQAFYDLVSAISEELCLVTAERQQELYAQKNQDAGSDQITEPAALSTAAIPTLLFQSLAARPYSLSEIGDLVHKFNHHGTMALLSLHALQAVVDQDLAGSTISVRHPGFNLH